MKTHKIMIYSDESSHTKNDDIDAMMMASIYMFENVKIELVSEINIYLKNQNFKAELKWTKVSNNKLHIYIGVIDIVVRYVKENKVRIRTMVAKNKKEIALEYNAWYRSMYYYLTRFIVNSVSNSNCFHILFDAKDNNSGKHANQLQEYLTKYFKHNKKIIATPEKSYNHRLIQVADLISGAMGYKYRNLDTSKAKLSLVSHIEKQFNIILCENTYYSRLDFNNFIWTGKKI